MDLEKVRLQCLSKLGASESFPFDNQTLVFKVGGKIFALLDVEQTESINLKCEPEKAIELRERFISVMPGYHMNKKHWNTIQFNKDLSDQLILDCIDESYQLVYQSLSKKQRSEITAGSICLVCSFI
jgi:predicted DNA-binding protein (MmcQ/YjbR family)